MAPKLKGKELAAFKKAEKAQFEEIAKRFEQERLIVETMEIVRKEQEAQRAYEAEQAWLKAERERLADETESMKPMFKKHHDALMKIEADALAKKEWELFMDTSGLPQAAKEATINTYLEVGSQTLDLDYNAVLKSLVDIYKSAGEAEALALQEDQKGDAKEAAKYRGFMQKLEKLGIDKMDRTTNYLLQVNEIVFCI
ncbi:hypothetical protein M758_4G140200 [Ceratodon purpureus]|uniref:IC97/Casc1 N-terminal domain-containing protein n=1 Tax=Ceratodon purpureus TaxID=3225 RepID=A0A8T0IAN0_CERPU|nr:hypothetical protein KC19_4G138600 [Ceratodon purpureus]KAG0579967.1 hypothetical protein KC19_4G138600 [Ceratodon purpureus]KAG0619440.1 hypothetical protein M758_4G140200 [Ceratodon purpureus]